MMAAMQGTIAQERPVLTSSAAQNFAPAATAFRAEHASPQNSESATPGPAPSAQMLVMVVHSEERDEAGMIFWSVRVVRWMVFRPQTQDRVVDPQVPSKT